MDVLKEVGQRVLIAGFGLVAGGSSGLLVLLGLGGMPIDLVWKQKDIRRLCSYGLGWISIGGSFVTLLGGVGGGIYNDWTYLIPGLTTIGVSLLIESFIS